ncbi:MAG: hypothetical protein IMW92_14335, partial [Bacillales bacterium]|nr:hypothetical protein [Bacillales bacterium]
MADESLWIWGNAIYGMYPIKTQKTIQHVIAEGMHVLILTVDGEVYAWGEHAVRPGDTILKNNRTEIAEDWSSWYGTEAHRLQELTHVKEIALDPRGFFALARKEDGSIWIWGENTITNIPRAVPLTNVPIVKRSHESISVKSDGSFYLVDDQGKLWFIALIFTKNASSAHSFVRVETRICNHPFHEAVQEVSAGPYITLIRTVSGRVWMKGAGNDV